MIRSFEIKDPSKTLIPYLPTIPALAKPRKFTFGPGLNILWGANGSGKTTLIRMLARLFHCEQGGETFVTHNSIRDLGLVGHLNGKFDPESIVLDHDGQSVRFFDPTHAHGLVGGMAGFDDDFFMEGVKNVIFKGSAGQTTMARFDKIVNEVFSGVVPEVQWKPFTKYDPNEKRKYKYPSDEHPLVVETLLKGSGEKGPSTLLFDEPDRSLDLPHQVAVWRFIRSASTRHQVIVAGHSLFALNVPEANYIDMVESPEKEKSYLMQSMKALNCLSRWQTEAVIPLPTPEEFAKQAKKKPKKADKST